MEIVEEISNANRFEVINIISKRGDYSSAETSGIINVLKERDIEIPKSIRALEYEYKIEEYGAGLFGFWKGTQSLALAFWGVLLLPIFVALIFGVALHSQGVSLENILLLSIPFSLIRIFAWVSIFKCRHNTKSNGFSVFVLIFTTCDIIRQIFILVQSFIASFI